jgi:F0F1-type ATP synthase membrane subunit b/b'
MSTGAWIAIIAGAAILLLILFAAVVPRMRARRHEHQLETRRGEMAEAHREEAQEREAKARLAESEAQRERAEAELHSARADLHERGLADEELDREHDPRTTPGDPQR